MDASPSVRSTRAIRSGTGRSCAIPTDISARSRTGRKSGSRWSGPKEPVLEDPAQPSRVVLGRRARALATLLWNGARTSRDPAAGDGIGGAWYGTGGGELHLIVRPAGADVGAP